MPKLIKGDCMRGLNEFQIKSLLTKNYMSEFNLIEDYEITFNENGTRAKIDIIFNEVNKWTELML